MADPQTLTLAGQFRNALLMQERPLELEMAAVWREIARELEPEMTALVADMADQSNLTRSRLYRNQRYQALLAQLLGELKGYGLRRMGKGLEQHAQIAATWGATDAAALIKATGGSGVAVALNRLPKEAVAAATALAREGKPLAELLERAFPLAAEGVTRELITGVALGRSPRDVARRMQRHGLGQGLNHTLLVARDQSIRAYRTASLQTYRANDHILRGYMRLAPRSTRTCMACIALDGTEYALGDLMPLHPQDRCTMVPLLKGEPPPERQPVWDWLMQQPPAVQEQTMGKGLYKLWKAGRVRREQLVTVREDGVWGPSAVTTPIKQLQ